MILQLRVLPTKIKQNLSFVIYFGYDWETILLYSTARVNGYVKNWTETVVFVIVDSVNPLSRIRDMVQGFAKEPI